MPPDATGRIFPDLLCLVTPLFPPFKPFLQSTSRPRSLSPPSFLTSLLQTGSPWALSADYHDCVLPMALVCSPAGDGLFLQPRCDRIPLNSPLEEDAQHPFHRNYAPRTECYTAPFHLGQNELDSSFPIENFLQPPPQLPPAGAQP